MRGIARLRRWRLVLALSGVAIIHSARPGLARPQEPTPEQRAWLRGHRSEPSLAASGGWGRRAAAVRATRAALWRAGRLGTLSPAEVVRAGAALSGKLNVAVLAVTYPDVPKPFTTQALAAALFGPGSSDVMTVAQYYSEVSHGLMRIAGEVTPWIVVDSASSYYLAASEYGWPNRGRISEFLESVFRHADSLVDWRHFDNDGPDGVPNSGDDDGVVDMLWIFYATNCNGEWRNGFIWPGGGQVYHVTKSASASGGFIQTGPAVFMGAQRQSVCAPAYPGVLAHETAHAFGLPDLYDYDFSTYGVGNWDLMAYGLYNTEASPAYIGAYGRDLLGWIGVSPVPASDTSVTLDAAELAHVALRYQPAGSSEYFLLENRQPLGTDLYLPGGGLLVWHVDPGVYGNDDDAHRMVDLEEADGRASLHGTSLGDAGDPFPGSAGNPRFGTFTNPSSRLYTGTPSSLLLDAIAPAAGSRVSFTRPGNLVIADTALRAGLIGARYADTLSVLQLTSGAFWQVTEGALPDGLALDPWTGVVSGIPLRGGHFTFTVTARLDVLGATGPIALDVLAELALSGDSVMAQLLRHGTALSPDEQRYLDLTGNGNGRLDVGDVAAWMDRTPAQAPAPHPARRRGP